MIKNIIFDFGQVLVHFNPYYMASRYAASESDARLLSEVVFDRLYWDKLDDGTISDEEVVRLSCERLPERLHAAAHKTYYNWIYNIPPVEGMWELVRNIKKEGKYRLFLLSNISDYFTAHADEIAITKDFELCIYSASVGAVKPDKKIFDLLCKSAGILPEECLFIDDSQRNIDGAKKFGIKGYLFDGSASKLLEYINKL